MDVIYYTECILSFSSVVWINTYECMSNCFLKKKVKLAADEDEDDDDDDDDDDDEE